MAMAQRALDDEPLEHEIDPAIQKELLAHAGKWVALTRSQILAVGGSPALVLREAAKQGVLDPILYRVPENPRAGFFF